MFVKTYLTKVSLLFAISILAIWSADGCVYDRHQSSVNCSSSRLKEVPQRFKADIEILDMSENRLRELTTGSFSRYTNLRTLILHRNSIFAIENGTFSRLSKLTTLDLSVNVLYAVPCHLPASLVRLYLDANPVKDEPLCLRCLSPLTALEVLSLRDGKLRKFPRFCEYAPHVAEIDVTDNAITMVEVEGLAVLCALRRLKMSSVPATQPESQCQCSLFEKWIKDHEIETVAPVCSDLNHDVETKCNATTKHETTWVYEKCREEYEYRRFPYTLLVSGCILIVVCASVIVYAVRRWKRKRTFEPSDVPERGGGSNAMTIFENSP